MKRLLFFLGVIGFLPCASFGQKELLFTNLDSVLNYAVRNSAVSKVGAEQVVLARYEKLASVVNIINLRSPLTFSMTDNTQLPVSFIPSNLLGGPPGSYKEITLGQQYVSNFNITPQIDIINPGAWSRLRSASLNEELTAETNLLNRKNLFESISACWYNILSLQEQIAITQRTLFSTDTLLQIVNNKYAEGLVRHQDVNDATVNKITLEDKVRQLDYGLQQQTNSLKILCDAPEGAKLTVAAVLDYKPAIQALPEVGSQLTFKTAVLQSEMAKTDLRTNRVMNLPVVSLLYSHSNYQNSNDRFFDNSPKATWLNSTFFGAKITLNLPDVNQIVLARNSKINYRTALINLEHNKLQNDLTNSQLLLDYEKAISQVETSKRIYELKEENYHMAREQYNQALIPFDKLMLAFNEMLANRLNYSTAMAGLLFNKTKIDINNQIK